MPWRSSICACRYSGSESQNLLTTTCVTNASVAMPPSIGRSGASATTTAPSQVFLLASGVACFVQAAPWDAHQGNRISE
jgi:hypothetical protein